MNDMCDIYTHMYVPKSFRMQNIYQHYSRIKYIEGDFLGIRTVMEFSLARAKVFGPIKWTGDSVHPMHIFNGFVLAKKGGMKLCAVNNCFIYTHKPYPPGTVTHLSQEIDLYRE